MEIHGLHSTEYLTLVGSMFCIYWTLPWKGNIGKSKPENKRLKRMPVHHRRRVSQQKKTYTPSTDPRPPSRSMHKTKKNKTRKIHPKKKDCLTIFPASVQGCAFKEKCIPSQVMTSGNDTTPKKLRKIILCMSEYIPTSQTYELKIFTKLLTVTLH